MLKGKQKRYLRALAHGIRAEMQLGKEGITEGVIFQVDEMLEHKELVKISVLPSSPIKLKELADMVAEKTVSELVQIIGKRFLLYRRSDKKPVIELPL